LIEIGSKTAEKNSAQTNRQTDRQTDRQTNKHYQNNGHLAVNQHFAVTKAVFDSTVAFFHRDAQPVIKACKPEKVWCFPTGTGNGGYSSVAICQRQLPIG